MRPLSASEAIGPALERTQDMLFRPFRLGTFFKIAAVAFFAEMGGGFNSFSNSFSKGAGGTQSLPPAVLAFIVAFAVIVGLISLIIGLILFYVGSRLQLVLVELIASRQTYVSPMWRKAGGPVWRWIGLKVLLILGIIALMLPFLIPLIVYAVHHAHSPSGGNPFSGVHIAGIIGFASAAFVVLLVIIVIFTLVRDLALPSLALEDVGISEALRRLRALVSTEPGPVALYVLLRVVLGFAFGIGAEIAVVIVLLVSLIPPGILAFVFWLALHSAGSGGKIILVILAILGGMLFFCWAVFVTVSLIGAMLTFMQAYALYFLGGRYPLLGDLLDRSTPPPTYAYPTLPPQPPYSPPQSGPPLSPSSP